MARDHSNHKMQKNRKKAFLAVKAGDPVDKQTDQTRNGHRKVSLHPPVVMVNQVSAESR